MRKLRPWPFSCAVKLLRRTVRVECTIVPARPMSHLSITSPSWRPGGPERVKDLRVLEDAQDVSSQFAPAVLAAIRDAVLRASRAPYGPARFVTTCCAELAPFAEQFPLEAQQ